MRIRTHTNPFHLTKRFARVPLDMIFSDFNGKIDFEIGFGMGVFIRHYAKKFSEKCIVCVEVRKPLVDALNVQLMQESISNVAPFHTTDIICMEDIIPNCTIENIFIFHPDPWFKKRHHKRRVVNDVFLALCIKKLIPNGRIYISTDVKDLFEDIQSQFAAFSVFSLVDDQSFWDTTYKTHWQQFSIQAQRQEYCAVYQLNV